jgi:pimeloyl-ACP methyl ester carboxylesterase
MPYQRSTLEVEGGELVYHHTAIDQGKPTVLFLHGLGDRGCVFQAASDEPGLRGFNLVAPDLPGYGESQLSATDNHSYTFKNQIACLNRLIDHLKIAEFVLVGHSMGGDIGSLMCNGEAGKRIRAVLNIEGDLTEADRFISDAAVRAHEAGDQAFESWLRHELIELLFDADRSARFPISRKHYEEALQHCSPQGFWTNVQEIRVLNSNLPGLNFAAAALLFERIRVPKDFYWSDASLADGTQAYLQAARFEAHAPFQGCSHWIMLDQREKFYNELAQFLARPVSGNMRCDGGAL